MTTVDVFQILIVTVGGGGLITAITIGYNTGKKHASIDARLLAIEDHFKDHGRVGLLWRFFEDGTLHSLRAKNVIRENSPLSLVGAIEHVAGKGGVPRDIYNRFLSMFHRAPTDNPGIVAFVVAELGWDTLIKERAKQLGWTRAEYVYQWKVAIEEAQRDGLDAVRAKIEPMVVD